jgi:type IV pilus biogenesis protein PilP
MKSKTALSVLAVTLTGLLGASAFAQSAVPTAKSNVTVEQLRKNVEGKPAPTTNQAAAEARLTPSASASGSQALFQNPSTLLQSATPVTGPGVVPGSLQHAPVNAAPANTAPAVAVSPAAAQNAQAQSVQVQNASASTNPQVAGLSGVPFQSSDDTEETLLTVGHLQAKSALQKFALDVDKQIQTRKDYANGVTRTANGVSGGKAPDAAAQQKAAAAPAISNPRVTSVYGLGDHQFAEISMGDGTRYVAEPGTRLPGGFRVGKVHDGGVDISNGRRSSFYPVQVGYRVATGAGAAQPQLPQSTAMPAGSMAGPAMPPVALPPMPAQ